MGRAWHCGWDEAGVSAHVLAVPVASAMRVLPVVPVLGLLQSLFIIILHQHFLLFSGPLLGIEVGYKQTQTTEYFNET